MKHGKHSLTTTIRKDVLLKGRNSLKLENSHVVNKKYMLNVVVVGCRSCYFKMLYIN